MAGRQIQGRGGRRHRLLTPHDLAGIISGQSNDTTGGVSSVNGKTGSVILIPSDIGAAPDSALQSIIAGTNISVDNTDPRNPKISAGIAPPVNYDAVVLADAPVAYWKLNETSGTAMVDSSGNSRDGTYSGGVTFNQRIGNLSGAVRLDGVSGHATVPYGSWMDFTTGWTVECWIQPAGFGVGLITRAWTTGQPIQYAIMLRSGSGSTLSGFGGGKYTSSAWDLVSTTANGAIFSVFHVVATFDGTTIILYVNGFKIGAIARTGFATAPQPLYIGADWSLTSNSFLNGLISSCALYSTALSESRVIAHYNAGK